MTLKERKDLLVFGYGVSLLIPFFVFLHDFKQGLSFVPFVFVLLVGFTMIMFVISKMALWESAFNLWVLPIPFGLILYKMRSSDSGGLAVIFLLVSILSLFISIFSPELLKPFYSKWMKVAHFIGLIFSAVILSLIFFLVFGIVGIILRLLRKDILSQHIEPDKESYWIRREKVSFNKGRYTQQF